MIVLPVLYYANVSLVRVPYQHVLCHKQVVTMHSVIVGLGI